MFILLFGITAAGGVGGGLRLPIYADIIKNDSNIVAFYRLDDTTGNTPMVEATGQETTNGYYQFTYTQSQDSLLLPTGIDTENNYSVNFNAGYGVGPTDGNLENLGKSASYADGYTITALIVMDTANATQKMIAAKWDNSTLADYMGIDANEKLELHNHLYQGAYYAPTATGSTTLVTGRLYHVAVRMGWSGNSVTAHKGQQVFLDGKLDNNGAISWTNASDYFHPTTPWTIGALGGPGLPFYGTIDEIAFFGGTISNSEIEYHANVALGKFDYWTMNHNSVTPISYWRFNETSGTIYDAMGLHDLTNLSTGGTYNSTGIPNSLDGSWTGAASNGFRKVVTSSFNYSSGAVEFWVKSGVTTVSEIILQSADESDINTRINFAIISLGRPSCWMIKGSGNTSQMVGQIGVADGKWHHIVYISTGSTYKMYVDGKETFIAINLAGTGAAGDWFADITPASRDDITIGYGNNGGTDSTFASSTTIAQVSVFDQPLSDVNAKDRYIRGTGYHGQIEKLGYVGHWNLGERFGTTATDLGGTYNGTYTGIASLYNKGNTFTHAAEFNPATPSYISIADNAALELTTGAITIAAWVKYTATSGSLTILSKDASSSNSGTYHFQTNGTNKIRFSFYDGVATNNFDHTSTIDLTDAWHHVAVTHIWGDETSTRLYIDSEEMTGGAWTGGDGTGSPTGGTDPLKIGARSNDNASPWEGFIQHVTLSDRYYSDYDFNKLYTEYTLDPKPTIAGMSPVIYEQDFADYNVTSADISVAFPGEWDNDNAWAPSSGFNWDNTNKWMFNNNSGIFGLAYLEQELIYAQNIRVSATYGTVSGNFIYPGVTMKMPTPDVDDDADNGYAFYHYGTATRYWRISKLSRYGFNTTLSEVVTTDTMTAGGVLSMEWIDGWIYGYFDGRLKVSYNTGLKVSDVGYTGFISRYNNPKFLDFKVEYL